MGLLLDFVLCALRALRPCDPLNDALDSEQTLVLVGVVVVVILHLLLLSSLILFLLPFLLFLCKVLLPLLFFRLGILR